MFSLQPCGDEFIITRDELMEGLEEATCPSCSLVVKVIYNKVSSLLKYINKYIRRCKYIINYFRKCSRKSPTSWRKRLTVSA